MAQNEDNKVQFIEGFTEEIRTRWITYLFEKTVSYSKNRKAGSGIIYENWKREAWKTPCHDKNPDAFEHCKECEWKKIYKARYYPLSENRRTHFGTLDCPLRTINDFIADVQAEREIFQPGQNGLKQLLNFFCLWVWFLDEVNGTIYFPSGANPAGNNVFAAKFIERMELPLGSGSMGYALRSDQGICLSDTFADPRGGVALEDVLARNFSYLAVPVREQIAIEQDKNGEQSDNETEALVRKRDGDQQNKIIAYVALSYPLPYAWHPKSYKCRCNEKKGCFYEKFRRFVAHYPDDSDGLKFKVIYQSIEQRVRNLYLAILNDKLSRKISDASRVATESKGVIWNKFLSEITVKQEHIGEDALGINYASIWRYSRENKVFVKADDNQSNSKIVKHIALKHRSKLIARYARGAYVSNLKYHKELYDSGGDGDNAETHIDTGIQELRVRIICDRKIEGQELKKVKNIFDVRRDEILSYINCIAKLSNSGSMIYKSALRLARSTALEPVLEDDFPMVVKKIMDGACDKVITSLFKGGGDEISAAYQYWHKTGEDQNSFYLPKNDPLLNEIKRILHNNDVNEHFTFTVAIWIDLSNIIPWKQYVLAYDNYQEGEDRPWAFVNLAKLQLLKEPVGILREQTARTPEFTKAFIERNFKSYDTYKVIDYVVNYGMRSGGHTDLGECHRCKPKKRTDRPNDCAFISVKEKWSSVLSFVFDCICVQSVGEDKYGILHQHQHKGDLKKILSSIRKEISIKTKVNDFKTLLEDAMRKRRVVIPCFIFHLKKESMWSYVQVDGQDDLPKVEEAPPDIEDMLQHIFMQKMQSKSTNFRLKLIWNVYENGGRGGWNVAEKEDGQHWQYGTVRADCCTELKRLHEAGTHAIFVFLIGKSENKLGLLVIGRSLLHPEEAEYVSFTKRQLQVIDNFVHTAAGWFKLINIEKERTDALRAMAITQAHEMRNIMSPLLFLRGALPQIQRDDEQARDALVRNSSRIVAAIENIQLVNNAIESANAGVPESIDTRFSGNGIGNEIAKLWNSILRDYVSGFRIIVEHIKRRYGRDMDIVPRGQDHSGSLPIGIWKMIMKELLKNAIKYCDYCYHRENCSACKLSGKCEIEGKIPVGITTKLTLLPNTFVLDVRNGIHPAKMEADFKSNRYSEINQLETRLINRKELFSTNIGQENISRYIYSNYGIKVAPDELGNEYIWNIEVPYQPLEG
jgi:hypothetical protein